MKQIDLDPREYSADIPNKKEPFFGPEALNVAVSMIWWLLIGAGVRYFLHR